MLTEKVAETGGEQETGITRLDLCHDNKDNNDNSDSLLYASFCTKNFTYVTTSKSHLMGISIILILLMRKLNFREMNYLLKIIDLVISKAEI